MIGVRSRTVADVTANPWVRFTLSESRDVVMIDRGTRSGDNGSIRLVATDLDGMFWGSDLRRPQSHVTAAADLVDAGVTVLAATSRRTRTAGGRLAKAGLVLPAVLIDGALGVDFCSGERLPRSRSAVPASSTCLIVVNARMLNANVALAGLARQRAGLSGLEHGAAERRSRAPMATVNAS